MTASSFPPAPDQTARDRVVAERGRNVVVDAGAGTGKTTLLVARLIEMVAPQSGAAGLSLERIAAITFTRKAAGELKLKIREGLLEALAAEAVDDRRERLRAALSALDTAYVGTIHSFADRLLRKRPREAWLSPAYDIAEDVGALVHEAFELLRHAAETRTLADELQSRLPTERAEEAAETVELAMAAGLKMYSQELEFYTRHGLDGLFAELIRYRDVRLPEVPLEPFDREAFRGLVDEYHALLAPLTGDSTGLRRMRAAGEALRELIEEPSPATLLRELDWRVGRAVGKRANLRRGTEFEGDKDAWAAWKVFAEGRGGRGTPLRDDLWAVPARWLAHRLVRLQPVAVALYERVKARREVVDQVDLLLKLRDLLAGDREARGFYQGLFDHVLVDEFQDTDPLQAEIIVYLCEQEPQAVRWRDAVLSPGKLTLVGDPKQSIYRFRRADVAMYDDVRRLLVEQGALEAELSANFRSRPALVQWLNHRFEAVLGLSADGAVFDPETGQVFQRPLLAGRAGGADPAVHVVPFDVPEGSRGLVGDYRAREAQVMARYLRWLVERSGFTIADPVSGESRSVRYGDVGVLAIATSQLPLLFAELDGLDIPYASRGGTLFLRDDLHRRFLLGLRAIADRDDGVAEAALLRPPFFAVDPRDLLLARGHSDGEPLSAEVSRARAALDLVRELRRGRFERAPGTTARHLLERTAVGRVAATGPNGAQRLARLRELCFVLEQKAADEHLDYDAVTAHLRQWVDSPAQLDPPHPVGTEAVRVMTVHQAKGLEFPVVVLWDCRAPWDTRGDTGAWRVERDGRAWTLALDKLSWEEPRGFDMKEREKRYNDAERRRVAYVAATRARDLLVLPRGGNPTDKCVPGALLLDAPVGTVTELAVYGAEVDDPWWEVGEAESAAAAAGLTPVDEAELAERWRASSAESARPRFRPMGVSAAAHRAPRHRGEDAEGLTPAPRKPREGRYGRAFGTTVHRALELLLTGRAESERQAVEAAAREVGLANCLDEALADVCRAITALRREGLLDEPGVTVRVEYPIAGAGTDGTLLTGYVDYLAVAGDRMVVIDFKTDAPPAEGLDFVYPQYVEQVRGYVRLLGVAGLVARHEEKGGLLFTADGIMHWV